MKTAANLNLGFNKKFLPIKTEIMYLYGAGGHSNVVRDVLSSNGVIIEGMFDDDERKGLLGKGKVDRGVRLPGHKLFASLDKPLIICIGNNVSRALIDKQLNGVYGTAIHKSALIAADVEIGEGTVVLHGAIIQTGAKIGRHVLINTSCSVDHDNVLGDYVHISPKAALCGHVTVGEGTHIGAGAVVIPSVTIGRWCVIGAGAVVIRDIPDFSIVVGNPARILEDKSIEHRKHLIFEAGISPDLITQ